MSIQEALKLLRSELGMTQRGLAKAVNRAYITVNRWENGKTFPSRENSKDIIEAAERGNASGPCISYLREVLLPDCKRSRTIAKYGFPDIDRDFMFRLADDSANAIYVIESVTYKLLYINRKAEEMAEYYRKNSEEADADIERGSVAGNYQCFRYMAGKKRPCEFCPLANIIYDHYRDSYVVLPELGKRLKVHAKTEVVNGKRAYILNVTDITGEASPKNALKAGEMK